MRKLCDGLIAGSGLWVGLMACLLSFSAAAEDEVQGGRLPVLGNTLWRTECGSCHLPYPPALLSAPAWHRIMNDLDHHFGTSAVLEPAARTEITRFLDTHAGSPRGVAGAGTGGPLPRITTTPWFRDQHGEVAAAVWKRSSVRSPGNCAACHPKADAGDFSEDRVAIPR